MLKGNHLCALSARHDFVQMMNYKNALFEVWQLSETVCMGHRLRSQSFYHKSNLSVHDKIHTNEKPF